MTDGDVPRESAPPRLERVIGTGALVATAANCIVGSGIFGLPGLAAFARRADTFVTITLSAAITHLLKARLSTERGCRTPIVERRNVRKRTFPPA
jgi:hypothetical protein